MRRHRERVGYGTAADQPQAPPDLRDALRTLNRHVDDYINRARLGKAA